MEHGRFDALARAFGAALTRRSGIRAAAAALVMAVPGREVAEEADARAGKRDGGRAAVTQTVTSEKRPCGPSANDNRCKKHDDCCTKYCRKGEGGKTGRCRCVKPQKKCKDGQTCCGGATCTNGTCTPKCTVCASGCQFLTVAAAYAAAAPGSTITIGSGTYPTEIQITKDMTFSACGGATDVVLTPSRATPQTSDSYYAVFMEDMSDTTTMRSVTLDGLRLVGTAGNNDEALILSYTNGTVSWTVRNCTLSGGGALAFATSNGVQVLENTTVTGNYYGIYVYMDDPGATATVTNCTLSDNESSGFEAEGGTSTVTGCTITGNGYGGIGVSQGALTIHDTSVTGNSDDEWGGGVWAYATSGNSTITLSGSTVVTGNTAPDASGFGINEENSYTVTVVGVSSANVYGNLVGDQCERSTDDVNFTPVPNCAF